jgi:short-subunit dehydrogenase
MGRSLARLLLQEGCRVAIVDIRETALEEAREELSNHGEVASYACDISDKEKVYALAQKVQAEFGTIDILVNNAGVVKSDPFLEKPDEVIERTVAVNLLAHFWTMKAFLPGMVAKKEGHVVNMASAGGLLGVPYISDYCATKFAVVGLTESLRQEFKLRGLRNIRFTYVCPNTVSGHVRGRQGDHPHPGAGPLQPHHGYRDFIRDHSWKRRLKFDPLHQITEGLLEIREGYIDAFPAGDDRLPLRT